MRHTRWLIPASLVLGLFGVQASAPGLARHGQGATVQVLVLDAREMATMGDRGVEGSDLDGCLGERAARVVRDFAASRPPASLRHAILRVLSPPPPAHS